LSLQINSPKRKRAGFFDTLSKIFRAGRSEQDQELTLAILGKRQLAHKIATIPDSGVFS
jgi:hypothetical protein